jgi:DNA-binding transcriptional regulator YiaG
MSGQDNEGVDMITEKIHALMRPAKQSDLPPPADRARIRKASGISQTDFGEAIEVSRLTVSMWEQGKTEPQGENRRKYMTALRAIVDSLGIPWIEESGEQSDA